VVTAPADRLTVTVVATGSGRSRQEAEAARERLGQEVLSRLGAAAPPRVADLAASAAEDGRSWRATREIRATLGHEVGSLFADLAALPGVVVGQVRPSHGGLDGLRRTAIERATAAARRKGETAARSLGFTLGTVREVSVSQEERYTEERHSAAMVDVEARVKVRFALAPATSRAEVLAIAAAPVATPSATSAAGPVSASEAEPSAPTAFQVDIVSAVYDATGRGRFTTATGTTWRETVPAPADQRLRSGRRYPGTITLGIFGGYRMQLEGVPRILKVEPVGDLRP
jgi:hypothetical protein